MFMNVIGFHEIYMVTLYQSLMAEFLGTLMYVFFGVASTSSFGVVSGIQTALCYGFVTSCVVMSFGHISGAQVNPAVTLGLMCGGVISLVRGLLYIIAQICGAVAGGALIYCLRDKEDTHFGLASLSDVVTTEQGLLYEILATLIMVLAYLAVTDIKRRGLKSTAFISIGLAVCAAHLAIYHYTGAGLNPARVFGMALVNQDAPIEQRWIGQWIYWLGPLFGACLATCIYKILLAPSYIILENGAGQWYFEYDWC